MRRAFGISASSVTLLVLAACPGDEPELPDPATPTSAAPQRVEAPTIPGDSESFREMELPPGQFTRVLPTGDAYDSVTAPAFRSLCLNCHVVSQTSFAAEAWVQSLHARTGVTCAACHGSHEGTFVPQPTTDDCRRCHARQVESFLASAHGPERAPGMRCVSCHEVHATDRKLAASIALCTGCHLESEHVRSFPESRMGVIFMREGYDENGDLRAPDCVYCHMPLDPIMEETGDFRTDRVTLHDSAITVEKHPKDPTRLSDAAIEFLLPQCVTCHSERNARHRLENSDPLLRSWVPFGMDDETRRKSASGVTDAQGRESAP